MILFDSQDFLQFCGWNVEERSRPYGCDFRDGK